MSRVLYDGVGKGFGSHQALRDLDLEVGDGELLVLLGPSGCGKSTALRVAAGLDEPDRGRVLIGERCVNGVPPRERDVALVFQSYALYPHMTVGQNLGFPLRVRKAPAADVARRVAAVAAALGLGELLERKPAELSGGQRQRVALARALVREPAAFLLDEPLSNLDAKLRAQARAEIKALHARIGATFLYVTHDQVEAMTLADRIAVMEAGRIRQVGTPHEIYHHPGDRFVAGFVGSHPMTFVEALVVRESGALWLDAGGLRIPAPPDRGDALTSYVGKRVTCGIRPEDVGDRGTPVEATVELVEPLGHETILHARVGSHVLLARGGGWRDAVPGLRLELRIDAGAVHCFDACSGLAIGRRRARPAEPRPPGTPPGDPASSGPGGSR